MQYNCVEGGANEVRTFMLCLDNGVSIFYVLFSRSHSFNSFLFSLHSDKFHQMTLVLISNFCLFK